MHNNSRDKLRSARESDSYVDLSTYNGMVDICKSDGYPASRTNYSDQFADVQRPSLRNASPWQLVFNGEASADCPAFGVMLANGVNGSAPRVLPKTKQPDVYGCQADFFVAGPSGIKHQTSGRAQKGPTYVVAYDSGDGTPAAGECWGPRSGTNLLKKNTGGFIVLGVTDTTRHYVAVVSEQMLQFVGQTLDAIGQGAAGRVTVYTGAPGTPGSETSTGANVSNVYSRFYNIPAGMWVRCEWDYGTRGWEVVESYGEIMTGTPASASGVTAGNTGSFTVANGTGTPFTVTGVNVAAGICLFGKNYQIGFDALGAMYVLDPHVLCFAQFLGGAVAAGNSGTATIYDGSMGSESPVTGSPTVNAFVRRGAVVTTVVYTLGWTTGGWEVLDPETAVYAQFSATGSITAYKAGNNLTATIYSGTIGAETSTGVTTLAYLRDGLVFTGETYTLVWGPKQFEVIDPELTVVGQLVSSSPVVGPAATQSFKIFNGTVDAETDTGLTLNANIRYGVCLPSTTYRICVCQAKVDYEVEDPDYECFGQTTADVAPDGTGTLTIYTGTNLGTASSTTINPVTNYTSCTVKAGKVCGVKFRKAGKQWIIDWFHSQ